MEAMSELQNQRKRGQRSARIDGALTPLRAAGPPPPSVEAASVLCYGSAVVAAFLAFIALAVLLPRDTDPNIAFVDASTGVYLLILACGSVAASGYFARRGRAWPRWVLTIVALTELSIIGRTPLLWLAFSGVVVAVVLLWGPTARAFSRSVRMVDES